VHRSSRRCRQMIAAHRRPPHHHLRLQPAGRRAAARPSHACRRRLDASRSWSATAPAARPHRCPI
jgi:hypothetical protein